MRPSFPEEKVNKESPLVQGLPAAPGQVSRSRSVNDVSAYSYMYADNKYNKHYPPPPSLPPRSGGHGYNDHYEYSQANYHQYQADVAPNDELQAFHQYHAQKAQERAALTRAQSHLPPIYDNAPYPPHHQNNHFYSPPLSHQYALDNNVNNNKKRQQSLSENVYPQKTDVLPASAPKMAHAATTGTYYEQIAGGNNLRYELAQVENEKAAKLAELNEKRYKLETKQREKMFAEKELIQLKEKWDFERNEIIKSFGGKLPLFIIESEKLRKNLANEQRKNAAADGNLHSISLTLQNKLERLQMELKNEESIAAQTEEHNDELRRRCQSLRIEKLDLENELKQEQEKEKEIENMTNLTLENDANNNDQKKSSKNDGKFREYPPESTVIQNLLQAQVEFYFSDYNLKRDKRLLSDIAKGPKKGFLALSEVMKLSRIRQLCSEIETLEEALRRSNILTMIREKKQQNDEQKDNDSNNKTKGKAKVDEVVYNVFIGRMDFEKPKEKEFPFRRTVFIFGIPFDCSEDFLKDMLKPFGSVSKIQFDHSPDGIDRKIGNRFLNKPRVYTLYYYDGNGGTNGNDEWICAQQKREEMIFKYEYKQNDKLIEQIKCHKCDKNKSVSEGFYTTHGWNVLYCAQCAAQLAEDQLNVYYKERNIPSLKHYARERWLGIPPLDMDKRKTALVVFASQRQASKCAYVRTRVAYKGAFATHFHHYSKVKKEIVLQESGDQSGNNNVDLKVKEEENKKNKNVDKKVSDNGNNGGKKMEKVKKNHHHNNNNRNNNMQRRKQFQKNNNMHRNNAYNRRGNNGNNYRGRGGYAQMVQQYGQQQHPPPAYGRGYFQQSPPQQMGYYGRQPMQAQMQSMQGMNVKKPPSMLYRQSSAPTLNYK